MDSLRISFLPDQSLWGGEDFVHPHHWWEADKQVKFKYNLNNLMGRWGEVRQWSRQEVILKVPSMAWYWDVGISFPSKEDPDGI